MEKTNNIRVHRVGTITTGLSMIVFGILFLLHSFGYIMNYQMIFQFWPIMLIGLGMELLLASCIKRKFVYDKGAIVLLIVMTFFVIGMATVDVCLDYMEMELQYLTESNL